VEQFLGERRELKLKSLIYTEIVIYIFMKKYIYQVHDEEMCKYYPGTKHTGE